MTRLRNLGINLLAARNTALQSLVVEAPPPLVAELLGCSYNTAPRHAEIAAHMGPLRDQNSRRLELAQHLINCAAKAFGNRGPTNQHGSVSAQ